MSLPVMNEVNPVQVVADRRVCSDQREMVVVVVEVLEVVEVVEVVVLSFGFCFSLHFKSFLVSTFSTSPSLVRWQSKVFVSVSVGSPDLFQVVLRYANRGGSDVRGRVAVMEDGRHYYCGNCECGCGLVDTAAPFFSSHTPALELEVKGCSLFFGLLSSPHSSPSFILVSMIPCRFYE